MCIKVHKLAVGTNHFLASIRFTASQTTSRKVNLLKWIGYRSATQSLFSAEEGNRFTAKQRVHANETDRHTKVSVRPCPVGSDPSELSRDLGNRSVILEVQLGIALQLFLTWNAAVDMQGRNLVCTRFGVNPPIPSCPRISPSGRKLPLWGFPGNLTRLWRRMIPNCWVMLVVLS